MKILGLKHAITKIKTMQDRSSRMMGPSERIHALKDIIKITKC